MKSNEPDLTESTPPHVELHDDHRVVVIKDLRITSTDVYDFLSRFPSADQMENELKRAIEVGVAVLQKVQLVSDTDYFDKRIEQLSAKFALNIDALERSVLDVVIKNFDPAEAKSYTRQLNDFFLQQRRDMQAAVKEASESIAKQKNELETLFEESFDADDKQSHLGKLVERIDVFEKQIEQKFDPDVRTSITSKLHDKLEAIFSDSGSLAKILDQRLSVANPDSPLVKFKEEIRKEIEGLRIELAKYTTAVETKDEVVQKSPEKGYIFEDAVFDILQSIAKADADIVADVSKEQGETKRRSGDFTYDVSKLNKRIVVEARSRTITSVNSALADLQSSMDNRAAEYGIYVVESEEHLQKQIGIWNEYPDGKIITHAALLEVAVKVAKGRLALEQPQSISINIGEIRGNLQKIIEALKKLSTIKRQATSIRGSSDEIESLATEIQSDIKSYAKSIDDELAKGTTPKTGSN